MNMKYRRKTEIIEAVEWTGNIEDVENIEWIKDAITNNNIIFAVDSKSDKEAKMLIKDCGEYKLIDYGDYIVNRHKHGYVHSFKKAILDREYEVIEDNNKNTININVVCNTKEFDKHIIDITEPIKTLNESTIRFITRDQFILEQVSMERESASERFNSISKGYNFILSSEVDGDIMYYSVEYINNKLSRC